MMDSKDVNTGLMVVGSVALGALTLLAGPDTKNLGPRTRGHFMPEDFESQRTDGRYESSVAWAQDMVRNMKPIYSLATEKYADPASSRATVTVCARTSSTPNRSLRCA